MYYKNKMKLLSMQRKTFADILRFFLNNTSIHGCKLISNKQISRPQRIFWLIFSLFILLMTVFLFKHLRDDYMEHPTIITADHQIPITKINFPGISICSINKISKRKAVAFAKILYANNIVRREFNTFENLLEAIKVLANLYDFNITNKTVESRLQTILEKYDNLTLSYDPTLRLINLIPRCDEILLKCKWGGMEYNCNDLFLTRATFDGSCCVFNYIRPISRTSLFKALNNIDHINFKPRYPNGSGVKKGLRVVLNNDLDDYFVTTTESTGYVISIFNPLDYPDKSSGSLTEVLANSGTEVFISLDVNVIKPTEAIRILPPKSRQCLFNDEHNTVFGGYRHSDCLAACKVHAMKYLCQCIPFTQPLEETNYCSLTDLTCLSSFHRKWTNYYPIEEDSPELNFEKEYSIRCEHCFSACEDQIFYPYADVLPISANPTNNTYLNVYFERLSANAFRIDLTQTWYEVVSNFGGYISLLMGLSFISFVEIFLLVFKLFYLYFTRKNNKGLKLKQMQYKRKMIRNKILH